MLSINTNISSLIAQHSMSSATAKLNQAIERMTTGFKINHAKDNAANYSIATDMSTKMNAYMVAQDNAAIGMEMVGTAESIIAQMQDHASRLHALSIQARNNTYGAQSLSAIQSEANARLAEITRLYLSSEFNGISLFNRQDLALPDSAPKAGTTGFIDESTISEPLVAKDEYDGFIVDPQTYDDAVVNALPSIQTFTNGASGEFKIENANDLARLAQVVNDLGYDTSNAKFYLAADIDLASWSATNGDWKPIGKLGAHPFKGTFDGNGHVIKNLKIENETTYGQGLFGETHGNTKIANLGLENCNIDIEAGWIGGFVGTCYGTLDLNNCYITGEIKGTYCLGGFIGNNSASLYVQNCYSEADVSGTGHCVGGLVGLQEGGTITNSYATGNVSGTYSVGGLVGDPYSGATITNSYATGNVSGTDSVGGLAGGITGTITNSYATGNVSGTGNSVGGLAGYTGGTITNSYATGGVSGNDYIGGLVGKVSATSGTKSISTSYSLGNVEGVSKAGSLIGGVENTSNGTSFGTLNISDCYSLDNGMDKIGGCYHTNGTANTNGLDAMLAGILTISKVDVSTNLQIGIYGDENSEISFNTSFKYDLSAVGSDITSDGALNALNEFISSLNAKETELGAITNRLESVLDEIEIQYNNLASSRSTIRDADIADESSRYIQQQILQQASATLLATANQSPAIALQLI